MPEVAANTVEAVLSDWPVPENTPFTADLAIATVETDKAVVDVPAEAAGVILKVLVPAGAEVEVGAPIALLGDPGELVEDLDALLKSRSESRRTPCCHQALPRQGAAFTMSREPVANATAL